jgi:hypothetical protein
VPADGKNHKCSHMGCSWTFSVSWRYFAEAPALCTGFPLSCHWGC